MEDIKKETVRHKSEKGLSIMEKLSYINHLLFENEVKLKVDYKEILDVLHSVSDEDILKQKISLSKRRHLLMTKYNLSTEEFISMVERDNAKLLFNGYKVLGFGDKKTVGVDNLEITDECIHIEARTNLSYFLQCYDICIEEVNSKIKYYPQIKKNIPFNKYDSYGNLVYEEYKIIFDLSLKKTKYVWKVYEKSSGESIKIYPHYKRNAKLNEKIENSYYANQKWIIKLIKGRLCIYPNRITTLAKTEYRYLREVRDKKGKESTRIILIHLLCLLCNNIIKKEIWLISDRPHVAGDNGEAFFKFMTSKKDVKTYFVLDRFSDDYKRLKKLGKVIDFGSKKHKWLFLRADKIISASADNWVFNVLKDDEQYFKNLYKYDYVFLQHGIIQKDFSKWLNKCNKNIKVFVTSAKEEFDSIINGNYGYTEKQVKMTGLPRYDNLVDDSKKIIAIMPTWRKFIAAEHVEQENNKDIKLRGYSKDFKNTYYYSFYQSLLNDKRLITALEQYDYKCIFYLHPSFIRQVGDFESSSNNVIISQKIANYNEVFKNSALLITDYSSVAMDFAYLKKPIIYAQFDKEDFLNKHTGSEGYFNYEQQGFGKVCYNLNDTIDGIIEALTQECKMEDIYKKRVNEFFCYSDKNNCKRVYEAINNISKGEK